MGKPAAFVYIRFKDKWSEGVIMFLYVKNNVRIEGIGRQLYNALRGEFIQKNIQKITSSEFIRDRSVFLFWENVAGPGNIEYVPDRDKYMLDVSLTGKKEFTNPAFAFRGKPIDVAVDNRVALDGGTAVDDFAGLLGAKKEEGFFEYEEIEPIERELNALNGKNIVRTIFNDLDARDKMTMVILTLLNISREKRMFGFNSFRSDEIKKRTNLAATTINTDLKILSENGYIIVIGRIVKPTSKLIKKLERLDGLMNGNGPTLKDGGRISKVDPDFWLGGMKVNGKVFIDLGLIEKDSGSHKYLWRLKEILPQFEDAPSGVIKILTRRITKPRRTQNEILRTRQITDAFIEAFKQENNNDIAVIKDRLKRINGMIWHFSNLKDEYYKELQILRGYHYPHRLFKKIMKKHYKPYPEVANAFIYLAWMVITLKKLNEILPQSSQKRVQRWKNKIEQELNRPEIKEFLKRENFLEVVSGAEYNQYLFLSIKELRKYIKDQTHKDGTIFIDDENLNSIKAAISLQMKLKEEGKLNVLREEIPSLIKIFSNLWNKDIPSYIRLFPNNMTMILNEMGYYSCIAMAILENDHKWINIAKPTGTINLVSYKNPLLNAKTTHVRPITINLNNRKNALLLSGPNMGGKTMTGRAIGLAVLLNQAVLPIPAEETLGLGLFRNIYTVFPRPEHMHKGYGYFEALVKELTEIIKEAERNGNVFGDMEGNDSEQKLLGESLPALVEKLTKERESVLEHNGKDGGAAKDANRLRKVEEPQDKVLEKVMSALVEVSGSGLIQENRFARTLIEDAKWVANLSKTNRELALGAILYPFAGDKPTASTEAVSHYTIIIARLRQSFREHGTLLLDYIMDYVLKSLKVTPGGTDAPPKNSKVIDDPARANKELTNEAKEALAKIVTSSIVEKLDLTETSADTVMKRTIADYLSKKGYRHLGVILGNTLVVRAPPDSELVEKIKEFEQKYGVIVYAVN
ncbi:MAG: hypothetical protein KKE91_04675, partial [Candidatus Omnitrophica bacterium]|nr:hypothetical protein [Candidatus Omnitrophota bacterium]